MNWTPLHVAVEHSRENEIRQLVASGADINAKVEGGMTPLHLAIDVATDSLQQVGEMHGLPVIQLLIDLGADPDLKNDDGKSARDLAREGGIEL